VGGVGGEDQPVEEFQPRGAGVGEQPVLFGRGPDRAQVVEQPAGLGRLAVDADDAASRAGRLDAGAEFRLVLAVGQDGGDGPGAAGRLAGFATPHLGGGGAAQAAAGGEQAEGLEQIGLAGAVGAVEHHRSRRDGQGRARVGAEIGEGEGLDQEVGISDHCGWRLSP